MFSPIYNRVGLVLSVCNATRRSNFSIMFCSPKHECYNPESATDGPVFESWPFTTHLIQSFILFDVACTS